MDKAISTEQLAIEKKNLSWVGFSYLALLAIGIGGTILIGMVCKWFFFGVGQETLYLIQVVCTYGIGIPVAVLIAKKAPAEKSSVSSLLDGRIVKLFLICYFLNYVGQILSGFVSDFLTSVSPNGFAVSSTAEMLGNGNTGFEVALFVIMVFVAPVLEEWFFRKTLIDRLQRYGQLFAVLVSGVAFGLYHGNMSQLIPTTFLGVAFGYIYMQTGNIWYTVVLHMLNNFFAVSAMFLLTGGNVGAAMFLGLAVLVIVTTGCVMFFKNVKKVHISAEILVLPQRGWQNTVFTSPGILAGAAAALSIILWNSIASLGLLG